MSKALSCQVIESLKADAVRPQVDILTEDFVLGGQARKPSGGETHHRYHCNDKQQCINIQLLHQNLIPQINAGIS